MRQVFLRSLMILAVGLVILIMTVICDFATRPRTPKIDGPNPIARLEQVTLNGSSQWVEVRGGDKQKTILLFLHGGPGMPIMFLGPAFQRDLEKHFVIVHWDRRGAGKSYAAGRSWQPNVRNTLDDLHALAAILHKEFPRQKLILIGHSWGTYLGMLAISERPDLYNAYVGTGQMAADHKREVAERRHFFREEAKKRHDQKMLERLAQGVEPTEDDRFAYDAEIVGTHTILPILWLGLTAPQYTFQDFLNVPKGARRLDKQMRYDVISGPLDQKILSVRVPIYFVLGRHDGNTPPNLAAQYFDRLSAPHKRIIWFESSAHFPFLEEPQHFAEVLKEIDKEIPG